MSEHRTAHGLKKGAFLTAYRRTGIVRLACEAACVGRSSHYRWLEEDAAYRDAFELAKEDAAEVLEAEAHRRAVEGQRRYKFNKDGLPIRHPDLCECGHQRSQHVTAGELLCADPECRTCGGFVGAPYYEHAYSDTLLIFTLKGLLPDKYRDRVEVRGLLARLDINLLPNHLVARIAAGEHVEAVLASGASDAGITPSELVVGRLAPGPAVDEDRSPLDGSCVD